MNKVLAVTTGTALVAVLAFQQAEIAMIHSDVEDIKTFLVHTNEKMKYTSADVECL